MKQQLRGNEQIDSAVYADWQQTWLLAMHLHDERAWTCQKIADLVIANNNTIARWVRRGRALNERLELSKRLAIQRHLSQITENDAIIRAFLE